jgi:AraC-like DNA-binding protein/mannose-6-phosphate isomerase-like protein (cupin superfamily)
MRQLNLHPDDGVSDLLSRMQVHSTVYCLAELGAPWGLRVVGRNVAKFHLILEGQAWLVPDRREPVRVSAGDLVILPHGAAHAIKDDSASAVEALDWILLEHPLRGGARLSYGGPGAVTKMLCGGFGLRQTAPQVAGVLPEVFIVDATSDRSAPWATTIFNLLRHEESESAPGAKAIFAKIADVFLAQAIRAFLTDRPDHRAATVESLADPQIAEAVRLMHTQPDHGWTVAELAYRVGMSRSLFSDRFRQLVGEPPVRHLTRTRLSQAAAHLATTTRTLHEIARLCGYDSDAALSKAFKREYRMTPGVYRATASRRPPVEVVPS